MKHKILVVTGPNTAQWEDVITCLGRRKSFDLYCASSSADVLRILKREEINIILMDYDLSGVKIVNFLRRLKTSRPHVEIIFLAEKVSFSMAINALKEGAYDFYEFPIDTRLMMTVIGKALEKQALFMEKQILETRIREKFDPRNIVGRSKAMKNIMGLLRSVASKQVTILITGETGTGKEMIADVIHYNSPRAAKPYIKINCAAFNEGILESELFGHEKGSFTSAVAQRIGRFELADGGTIFLDEIGDISLSTQVKLLRVLQEFAFERVGGNETIKVDVRIIAATNRNLRELINQGKFREDLFYRLNVVHFGIPPLRERKEDIPLLVSTFINKLNEAKDYQIKGITKNAMKILLEYTWPGNIRELENAIESAMALSEGEMIEPKVLPAVLLMGFTEDLDHFRIPKGMTLGEIEKEIIRLNLEDMGGNKTRTAQRLGIGLRTLQRKLKEYGW